MMNGHITQLGTFAFLEAAGCGLMMNGHITQHVLYHGLQGYVVV